MEVYLTIANEGDKKIKLPNGYEMLHSIRNTDIIVLKGKSYHVFNVVHHVDINTCRIQVNAL